MPASKALTKKKEIKQKKMASEQICPRQRLRTKIGAMVKQSTFDWDSKD